MTRTLLATLALFTLSCQTPSPQPAPTANAQPTATAAPATRSTTQPFPAVADQVNLQNAHRVTAKVISGAQPEGEASFKALKALGIKTIVSVDGTTPDVATAHKYGMTYVHLPISYAGVTPAQGRAIAKALDEYPGPIYLHCHHGKHRSAAAVTVACIENGTLRPEQAESVLQTFGTGENYKGLWQAARDARPVPPQELRDLKVHFVETQKLPPLADAMVSVDDHWVHIKAIQKAGWKTPKDHPDLDPPHEALQLEELLRELQRTGAAHANVPDFQHKLADAHQATTALQTALAAKPPDAPAADAAFKRVAASCLACHKVFRD